MSKSWIQCEDLEWINLDHACWVYCTFEKGKKNSGGYWEVCAEFIKPKTPLHVIASYPTAKEARAFMDDLMHLLRLTK